MFKKLLQAALITFLLHLMVNSEPNGFKTAVNWSNLDALVFNLK